MQQSLPRGSMRINIFHEKNNRKKLERAANQKKNGIQVRQVHVNE